MYMCSIDIKIIGSDKSYKILGVIIISSAIKGHLNLLYNEMKHFFITKRWCWPASWSWANQRIQSNYNLRRDWYIRKCWSVWDGFFFFVKFYFTIFSILFILRKRYWSVLLCVHLVSYQGIDNVRWGVHVNAFICHCHCHTQSLTNIHVLKLHIS